MKTEELIGTLVADHHRKPLSTGRTLGFAGPLALLASVCLFAWLLGTRPDIGAALTSWRYLLKLLMAAAIAATATAFLLHLARPQHRADSAFRWLPLLALPLLAGFVMEMATLPGDRWLTAAIGNQPYFCLIFVPLLSLAPLAATLWALRQGAPQSPGAGGAVAGLAAGGMGAVIFALHCDNDSPFYVAIWYLGAIGIVTLLGSFLGRRVLRW